MYQRLGTLSLAAFCDLHLYVFTCGEPYYLDDPITEQFWLKFFLEQYTLKSEYIAYSKNIYFYNFILYSLNCFK